MFERRLVYHLDWLMIAALLLLCAIGVAMISSTTGPADRRAFTQVYAILIGLGAFAFCLSIDYHTLADSSHFIYGGLVVLLLYVLFFGNVVSGARRWIDLGFYNLQDQPTYGSRLTNKAGNPNVVPYRPGNASVNVTNW